MTNPPRLHQLPGSFGGVHDFPGQCKLMRHDLFLPSAKSNLAISRTGFSPSIRPATQHERDKAGGLKPALPR
jgi:hypothetical protein